MRRFTLGERLYPGGNHWLCDKSGKLQIFRFRSDFDYVPGA